jgi:hypothetical protein
MVRTGASSPRPSAAVASATGPRMTAWKALSSTGLGANEFTTCAQKTAVGTRTRRGNTRLWLLFSRMEVAAKVPQSTPCSSVTIMNTLRQRAGSRS